MICACCLVPARHKTRARSPPRRRCGELKRAAVCAARREATLSLPPRRPTTHHCSRIRLVGGSRPPAIDLKNSVSSLVSGRPSPALSTVFQLSQLGPEKDGANSFGSPMVWMIVGAARWGRVACAEERLAAATLGLLTVTALVLARGISHSPPS